MDTILFGRTGLEVSVVGLGTGGASKIGLGTGGTEDEAIAVVHRAIDLGITYFDSAEGYGTEEVLGRALVGHRDAIVLSTKAYSRNPHIENSPFLDAKGMREAVELALRKLRTDMIDVFHLHRVMSDEYDYCVSELVPALEDCRDRGLIRFIAISESTSQDGNHSMLHRAVQDDCWDVLMTGFNFFNQASRETVFPDAIDKDIAVEIMGSARGPYSRPDELRAEVETLIQAGELDATTVDVDDPLGFLLSDDGADSLAEASYRFARYEPGVHVVLCGTGNIKHLEENVRSLNKPPLRPADLERVNKIFGALRVVRS